MLTSKAFAKITVCAALLLTAAAASYTTDVSAAAAQTASSYALSLGMSSQQVSDLQSQLKTLGYFKYPTITGYYGTITEQAVKDMQAAYSIPVTGAADSATRGAINRAINKKAIVADSYNYMNIPYQWGGTTTSGFDCSGFVYYMFTKHNVAMNRTTSAELFQMGSPVSKSKLMPGDLVFFSVSQAGVVDHVGIYIGNGQFISSLRSKGIYVQNLDNNSYWSPRYLGAKRIY